MGRRVPWACPLHALHFSSRPSLPPPSLSARSLVAVLLYRPKQLRGVVQKYVNNIVCCLSPSIRPKCWTHRQSHCYMHCVNESTCIHPCGIHMTPNPEKSRFVAHYIYILYCYLLCPSLVRRISQPTFTKCQRAFRSSHCPLVFGVSCEQGFVYTTVWEFWDLCLRYVYLSNIFKNQCCEM